MNRISETIRDRLAEQPLVYVTRDIERALGIEPEGGYFVISNDTAYGREVQARFPDNVWLIKADRLLDTYELLALPEVGETISRHRADLLVFQNNARIERLAAEKGWNLLNPAAALSKEVEEKITQVKWLAEDTRLLPPHKIAAVQDVAFAGSRFVLQFNHAHTGEGTHIIESEQSLAALKAKFPHRECRITDFIEGPIFTVNVAVARASAPKEPGISIGNPSYQITGLPPFTDNPFATIGNDWTLPRASMYEGARREMTAMARAIGDRLRRSGWKGLFGIDVAFDETSGKTYLLEINARQPASATFESILQRSAEPAGLSIFEAHLAALIGIRGDSDTTSLRSGGQIVLRRTPLSEKTDATVATRELEAAGLSVILYDAPDQGKELLRIQTKSSLMENHGIFSSLGETVRDIMMKQ